MNPGHGHSHAHHDHEHDHDHPHDQTPFAPRAIVTAILLTFAFMIFEAVGGYFSNSMALVSDAAHMLTDVGAMLMSLFAIWVSRRPVTPQMSFGYQRAEILGALLSGLLTWAIAGVLVYEAVARLQAPPEVHGKTVLIVAGFGFIANLTSMRVLHTHKHDNINVRAAYIHVLADAFGSLSAIVAGAILWLTGWRLIDPIVTLVFAGLMLASAWSLVKESVVILMESAPSGIDPFQVRRNLSSIPGVTEVHDLHIWSVSSGKLSLSAHLITAEQHEAVLDAANKILKSQYGIAHTTLQIEHPEKFRSEQCYDCSPAPEPPHP